MTFSLVNSMPSLIITIIIHTSTVWQNDKHLSVVGWELAISWQQKSQNITFRWKYLHSFDVYCVFGWVVKQIVFFVFFSRISSYLPDNVHALFHCLDLSRPERKIFNKSLCFAQHESVVYWISVHLHCRARNVKTRALNTRLYVKCIYTFRRLFSYPSQLATIHIILVFLSLYF